MKSRFALRFLVDALGKLAMFVLTVFLARALGVEDFGKLAFAMAFVNVAYQLSESGMSLVFLREMGRVSQGNAAAHASAVWSEFFGLRLSLCLAVGAVGAAASFWVWPWEEPWILVAVLGWILGNSFVDFFHQVCNGAGDIRTSARIMALHRGLTLVLPVAFAVAGSGLSGVSVGMALGSLSGAALALAVVNRTFGYPFRPVWQPRVWAARLKTVLPLAVANLFGSVYVRLGILMLPWLGYNHEVGFFSAAHKLFEAGYLIPLAFVTIAIPHLSGLHHRDPVAFRREARKQFLFILGLACLWLA
jgi:O-antigen/teichoic acid export membrane protein